MRRMLVALCIGFLTAFGAGAQEIVIVKVRAHGQGATEAAAVKDAIVTAVGQVSGERITAASTLRMQSSESTTGKSEHSYTSDARVDSYIRGVVKGSRNISIGKSEEGIYKAEVEVDVATFRHSQQLERVRLAVVMGSRPLPASVGSEARRFAASLLDGMADKLVMSGKFAVLDRRQQEQTQREFDRIASGSTSIEERVRIQSSVPADFLVVLEVSDLSWSKSLLDSDRARIRARAIVYDYTSGQIRQAVNTNLSRLVKDGSLMGLAHQAGGGLAEQILENVFPARVVGYQSELLVINSGNGQFEVGDRVRIFRQGEALVDPYTKERLGNSETPVSEGTIDTVLPRISFVRVAGSREKFPASRGVTFVVRRSDGTQTLAPLSLPQPAGVSGSNQKRGTDDEKW
jgi:hypothetical protein